MESDKEIRASALRALRYFLNTADDVLLFTDLKLPTLIIRILDTNYDESAYDDRVQALKERRVELETRRIALDSFKESMVNKT